MEEKKKFWEYMQIGMGLIKPTKHDGSYLKDNRACAVGTVAVGKFGRVPMTAEIGSFMQVDVWRQMDEISVINPVTKEVDGLGNTVNDLFEDHKLPRWKILAWMKQLDV